MHNSADNAMLNRYGFMEKEGKYWCKRIDNYVSNFVLKKISQRYRLKRNAKGVEKTLALLCQMTNMHGHSTEAEFNQFDLMSLRAFRIKVEGMGNFIWKGDEICLTMLKAYLYNAKETKHETMNGCKCTFLVNYGIPFSAPTEHEHIIHAASVEELQRNALKVFVNDQIEDETWLLDNAVGVSLLSFDFAE